MRTSIKNIFKHILDYRSKKIQKRLIHKFMETTKMDNQYVEGEDKFIEKWSQLTNNVDVDYYRFFSKFCGKDPNIVPADVLVNIIEPILTPLSYRSYYSDKNMYDKLFPKGIMPKTILRKIGGAFYDENYSLIKIDDNYLMSFIKDDRIIVKPTVNSCSGIDVALYIKEDSGFFINSDGNLLTLKNLNNIYGNDFIIQECLIQSDFISQFNSTSVNTLIMTVYRSVVNNEPIVLSTVMRVGKKGSIIDNAHGGGKLVGINSNGVLNNYVIDQYSAIESVFNGVDYRNNKFILPEYDKAVEFGKKVAEQIFHHRLIALDIMIDSNGDPKLIEFNIDGYGYWAIQLTVGSIFGNYTDEIITYCKANKSKIDCNVMKYL